MRVHWCNIWRLQTSVHLNTSLRKLQYNSLWWIRSGHTNLCSVLHILILPFINFMRWPPNQCDAITLTVLCICETKLSEDVSTVIRISKYPENMSYGIVISLFRRFCAIFSSTNAIVILWVIVLWKWCITWPKYKKTPSNLIRKCLFLQFLGR